MVELVAKRYGTAIYELAIEHNQIEAVEKDLLLIQSVLLTEAQMMRILHHPKIGLEEKVALLEEAFKSQVTEFVLGLLVLVLKKKRQHALKGILMHALSLIDGHHNKIKAYIKSAEPLDDEQKRALIDRLETLTKKHVEAFFDVDTSLIGGLIIRIGDRILDNSIKGKMNRLTKALL